jgi:HD-GYP domain-containing protein (c-di-GMP phosphodiesterase class II)
VLATVREGAGTHFDPAIINTFESILNELLAIKSRWDSIDKGRQHDQDTDH